MKKKSLILLLIIYGFFILFIFPHEIFAQTPTPWTINVGGANQIQITPGAQADFQDLGSIVGRLLQYLFPLSGLILFGMIIISGFQMLTSAGNPKGIEGAKQRLTWGIAGFVIIFTAFWIMKALEFLLGIKVL